MRFPLEAGIDPGFSVEPEEIPAAEFTEEFLANLLEKEPKQRAKIFQLIQSFSRKRINDFLAGIFNKRQYLGYAVRKLANIEPDALARDYREFAKNTIAERTDAVLTELHHAVEANRDFINSKKDSDKSGGYRSILELSEIEMPAVEHIHQLSDAMKGKRFGDAIELNEVRDKSKKFITKILAFEPGDIDDLAAIAVSLAKLYVRFEQYIWSAHDPESTVDYAELLVRANELIAKIPDSSKDKISPRNLMVDEFQDTSPIQWEIIRKIAGNTDSVLFVGDEKQSIYRFRGSDVSVVRKGEDFVERRKCSKISPIPFPLKCNYRTSRRLLRLINMIFEKAFPGTPEYDFEARFQELQSPDDIADGGTLWIVTPDKKFEQARIARDIVLKGLDEGIPDEPIRNRGDFLILARSRRTVFDTIYYLRKAGIPAIPLDESHFYQAREIAFLTNIIDFLADKRRKGALFAILTHPVFNVSAGEIIQKLGTDVQLTLWQRLEGYFKKPLDAKNSNDFDSPLGQAYTKLSEFQNNIETNSIDRVLADFLQKREILTPLISSSSEVQWENVKKFLSHLRELVSDGLSLTEISRTLLSERQADSAGYAIPAETADVVRVSTIHSANGLEGKIVIVIDPGGNWGDRRNKPPFNAEPEFPGMVVPIPPPRKESQIIEIAKFISSLKEKAEYERLFYVALTRVCNQLFIIAKGNSVRHDSFFKKSISAFGGNYDNKTGELTWHDDEQPDGIEPIKPEAICYPDMSEKFPRTERPIIADYTNRRTLARKAKISVTKAAEFLACPELVESGSVNKHNRADTDEKAPDEVPGLGMEFGSMIHSFLALAPFESREQALELAREICTIDVIRSRFMRTVESFLDSDFAGDEIDADIQTEAPMWLNIGGLLIEGKLDAVSRSKIWDYKTGKRSEIKHALYSAQLNLYRLGFARFINIEPQNIDAAIIWLSSDGVEVVAIPYPNDFEDKVAEFANFVIEEKFPNLRGKTGNR